MFTANWFPKEVFDKCFSDLRGREGLRFLEIGTFEGAGAIYFFENFLGTSGSVVCVDPFLPYSVSTIAKIPGVDHLINEETLGRFLTNTKKYSERIVLIKGLSQNALPYLKSDTFDLSFIDGDHSRDAVTFDGEESFRLVKSGGYLVFDDYEWGPASHPNVRPKDAIDAFLKAHASQIEVVFKGWVVVVKKL